ncbi:hypothetical protein PTKIN_Ptkin18bG0107400 [Pterospermum kingtungense]
MAVLPNSTIYFSSANRTTWSNNNKSLLRATNFEDGSLARFILFQAATDQGSAAGLFGFGFGFYCNCPFPGFCDLSILFVDMFNGTQINLNRSPQVVWSANWNRPVRENATLKFSQSGNLHLTDENCSEIWSANTSGMSIIGMSIDEGGDLMLFNESDAVWESTNHPTDTLLLTRVIRENQQITSRITSVNASQGLFSLSLISPAMVAYLVGDPSTQPTQYLSVAPPGMDIPLSATKVDVPRLKFVQFIMGGMGFYYQPQGSSKINKTRLIVSNTSSAVRFLRLDTDGGLRMYGWNPGDTWRMVYFWPNKTDECWVPLKCGRYGVCKRGKCSCPVGPNGTDYFTPRDDQHPNHGCREIKYPEPAPSQGTSPIYEMVYFGNLSYFGNIDVKATNPELINEESCKEACNQSISCKAAFFVWTNSSYGGSCYLQSELLSVIGNPPEEGYRVSSYIKVITPSSNVIVVSSPENTIHSHSWNLIPFLYALLLTMIVVAAILCFLMLPKMIMKCSCQQQKDHVKSLISAGTLISFSYSELSCATGKFAKRLGRGGYGAVYKGMLKDGTMVAVKRLENSGQGVQEFLAEVHTIGNIHHINLVKLIGFCVEKGHRILVYEYMSGGSLDKWIYHENGNFYLAWRTRKKILLDIAKGLAYLHGDCRQRIAHLDVKPQNILLDDNFNAKISDFGLSKLINRDESQVVTRMRGTLGYLAPEWQHSRITVKADTYSFGIVLLEVATGRMVLDYSQPDSDFCLLNALKKKCLENKLMDIIDLKSEDVQQHHEEAINMIKLGLCCANEDHTRRTCMYTVVKLLEEEKMPEPACHSRFPLPFPIPVGSGSLI